MALFGTLAMTCNDSNNAFDIGRVVLDAPVDHLDFERRCRSLGCRH